MNKLIPYFVNCLTTYFVDPPPAGTRSMNAVELNVFSPYVLIIVVMVICLHVTVKLFI